jgi:ribosomal protein S1
VADVVKEGEAVECRVLAVDPDEQRMSLSIKALTAKAVVEAADDDAEPAAAEPPAKPTTKRTAPLKGGLGGNSAGGQFGLKW